MNYNLYLDALKHVSRALISVHHLDAVSNVAQLSRIVSKAANFLRPRFGETQEDRLEWRSLEAECLIALAKDVVRPSFSDSEDDYEPSEERLIKKDKEIKEAFATRKAGY